MGLFNNSIKKQTKQYTKIVDNEFISICKQYNKFYSKLECADRNEVTKMYHKLCIDCKIYNDIINNLKIKYVTPNRNFIAQYMLKLITGNVVEIDDAFDHYCNLQSSIAINAVSTKHILKYIEKNYLRILNDFYNYLTIIQHEIKDLLKMIKFEYDTIMLSYK